MPEGTTTVTLMLDLLSKIPRSEIFWGIVIGSGLTILGGILANRHERKLQREALDQDATQREKDRKMSLRRDVYLPAADSILRAQNLTMRLLNPATQIEEIALQLSNELHIIRRTLVVGSDKTIQSVLMISDALVDTFETLVFQRATCKKLDIDFDIITYGIKQCVKIDELIPPALVAIREEMELPFDQEAFSRIYLNSSQRRANRLHLQLDEFEMPSTIMNSEKE